MKRCVLVRNAFLLPKDERLDYAQSGLPFSLFVGENYAQSDPLLSPSS